MNAAERILWTSALGATLLILVMIVFTNCYSFESVAISGKANISCNIGDQHICDAVIPKITGSCVGQNGDASTLDGNWHWCRDDELTCWITVKTSTRGAE